jgi:hypothetical protein
MKITFRFKGGSGSGNFGHAGIPGKVGGSASGSLTAGSKLVSKATGNVLTVIGIRGDGYISVREKPYPINPAHISNYTILNTDAVSYKPNPTNIIHDNVDDIPYRDGWKAYFINSNNKLIEVNNTSGEHEQVAQDYPELLGLTSKDIGVGDAAREMLWDKIFAAGNIRVRMSKSQVNVDIPGLNTSSLKRLHKLLSNGKLPSNPKASYYFTDSLSEGIIKGITASYDDIMNAKYITNGELKEDKRGLRILDRQIV